MKIILSTKKLHKRMKFFCHFLVVVLCFDDIVQMRLFAAKLSQAGLDGPDYGKNQNSIKIAIIINNIYLIYHFSAFFSLFDPSHQFGQWSQSKIILTNFQCYLVDGKRTQVWWNDTDQTVQAAAYKIAQRSFHLQGDIFGRSDLFN